ncbi:MAG: xylulose kinase [Glaciihabitans sp.]|nr:xylulose kinase [Glaciihabitans sp.]
MTAAPADQRYVIGLDVGTTSAKAVVFTLDGTIVATGRCSFEWELTAHGTEISAHSLADGANTALRRALEDTPPGPVLGIGIASIAESGVLLDGRGAPIAPVIAWHDKRDGNQLDRLGAELGADVFSATTGLPFRHQWSITKHRWLRDNCPGTDTATLRLNVAEWIAFTLGAAPATELSLASRTGFLELATRAWWSPALEWAGLRDSILPELVSAGTLLGRVSADTAPARLRGAAITAAGQDHQAAAVGLGAIRAGTEVDSCGTAEALVRVVDPISAQADVLALTRIGVTVGWHAVAGQWNLLAGTEGGLLLGRTLRLLGVADFTAGHLDDDARAITAPAVTASTDAAGLLGFSGIGDGTTPAAIWRSSIELVTDQAAALHNAMSAIVGEHRELIVTGGWSNSEALLECKRRSLGQLSHPDVPEAGARGAAIFAGMAAGLWSSPDTHTLAVPAGAH